MKAIFGMLVLSALATTSAQAINCDSAQWASADSGCPNCASGCEVNGPTISYSCYGSDVLNQDWGFATNGGSGSGSAPGRKVALSKAQVQAKLQAMGASRPNRMAGVVKSIKLSR